jgi:hypothetical protein
MLLHTLATAALPSAVDSGSCCALPDVQSRRCGTGQALLPTGAAATDHSPLHTDDTRAYRGSLVSSPTYSGTTLALLGSRPGISIPALHTGHSGSSRCKFNHLYRHSQLHSATDDQRVLSEPGPYPINRPHTQHH